MNQFLEDTEYIFAEEYYQKSDPEIITCQTRYILCLQLKGSCEKKTILIFDIFHIINAEPDIKFLHPIQPIIYLIYLRKYVV